MCISLQKMTSESKSTSASASTSGRIRRQRRSLLDHIVDSVANMAPELERETTSTTSSLRKEVQATKTDNNRHHQMANGTVDNVSSLTSSIKHIELQDLRAEQASASFISTASSTATNLTSSFSSSWSTTRSHLLVAEEIVSHLESEAMVQQEDISYETPKEDDHEHEVSKDSKETSSSSPSCPIRHDPFAKDSKFSVGEDGLITLSSLLSDDEETGVSSGSFKNSKRSWMNRAA